MNVLEFIKAMPVKADKYYFGTHTCEKRTIAVYEKELPNETALSENTKTRSLRLSILCHWNERSDDTRNAAQALYDALSAVCDVESGNGKICFVQMDNNAPVDVGADGNGVFERVINCKIYYEEKERID